MMPAKLETDTLMSQRHKHPKPLPPERSVQTLRRVFNADAVYGKLRVAFSLLTLATAPTIFAAGAAVPDPASGDIFLGVRAESGTGAGMAYLVKIGNDSIFIAAVQGTSYDLALATCPSTTAIPASLAPGCR